MKKYLVILLALLFSCNACMSVQDKELVKARSLTPNPSVIFHPNISEDVEEIGTVVVGDSRVRILFLESKSVLLADINCYILRDICVIRLNQDDMAMSMKRWGKNAPAWVISHELGHVKQFYDGSVISMPSRLAELQADMRAGCLMAKRGFTLEGIEGFGNHWFEDTESHPGPAQRLKAIREGYKRCIHE